MEDKTLLKIKRVGLKMTQKQIAIKLGYVRQTWTNWEGGKESIPKVVWLAVEALEGLKILESLSCAAKSVIRHHDNGSLSHEKGDSLSIELLRGMLSK